MLWRAALLSGLLCITTMECIAHEIKQAEIQREGDTFHLLFTVSIDADPATVYRILTNYSLLPSLNDTVQESRVTAISGKGRVTRFMRMQSCLIFFCRSLRMVEHIEENGRDEIRATVDPLHSDFRSGNSYWRIHTDPAGHSLVEHESRFRPDFWIPPVIGTWLITNRLQREFETMTRRIEHMARP